MRSASSALIKSPAGHQNRGHACAAQTRVVGILAGHPTTSAVPLLHGAECSVITDASGPTKQGSAATTVQKSFSQSLSAACIFPAVPALSPSPLFAQQSSCFGSATRSGPRSVHAPSERQPPTDRVMSLVEHGVNVDEAEEHHHLQGKGGGNHTIIQSADVSVSGGGTILCRGVDVCKQGRPPLESAGAACRAGTPLCGHALIRHTGPAMTLPELRWGTASFWWGTTSLAPPGYDLP
jgi:hypothetical protein